MKFPLATALLSLGGVSAAFRDQTQKKIAPGRRHLEDISIVESDTHICTVNHDVAQSTEEAEAQIRTNFDMDDWWSGDYLKKDGSYFKITVYDEPWAPPGGERTYDGWCVDYGRLAKTDARVKTDIFTSYDGDLHYHPDDWKKNAVDKPERLPNVAYLINTWNIEDPVPACGERAQVGWLEMQTAIWTLIDDETNHDSSPYSGNNYGKRDECVMRHIADDALANGEGYIPDCTDPHELIPLVYVIDTEKNTNEGITNGRNQNFKKGDIIHQVVMSETNMHTIEGLCSCEEKTASPTPSPTDTPTTSPTDAPTTSPQPEERSFNAPPKASGSGDPHFKTWNGDKYDYHGECDLVLLDHPTYNNGQGLKIHIRTTRVKYFSYIEKVALQIGEEVLEFDNDVENFLINGEPVEANRKHHKTMFAGHVVRRDHKAISVRLDEENKAKIDFHTRKNGFPAVIVDAGHTDIFEGSLGMLGEWKTGRKLLRDGETEIEVDPEDGTEFALEWQVRDTEPMLFKESRFPQFPVTCSPPQRMPFSRLGMTKAKAEAEEACAHWEYDKEDCIFDVIATQDAMVAEEGHIVHVE